MRLYYGTYGHHLSGKLYVYWGDDNLRTGQQVVAPVTGKSGKTYNTMFTIARAQNEKNAQREVDRLTGQGIAIKTIGGRDTLSLPGGQKFDTKIKWKQDSDKRYRERFGLPETATPPSQKATVSDTPKSKAAAEPKPSKQQRARKSLFSKGKQTAMQNDSATEKAKSALLSKRDTAADSFKEKKSAVKLKQRKAFEE